MLRDPGIVEIGPIRLRALQRMLETPLRNRLVVAREKHRRNLHPAKHIRLRVGRSLQQTVGERLLHAAARIAEGPRQQARHRIDHHHRRNRPVRQDVVADGQLQIHERVNHALVHALVVAAEDDVVRVAALHAGSSQLARHRLAEHAALRRHENHLRLRAAQLLNRLKNRLALHEHPLAAAAEVIIRAAVAVVSPVAQLVRAHRDQTLLRSAPHDTLRQGAGDHLREKRQDINFKHGET